MSPRLFPWATLAPQPTAHGQTMPCGQSKSHCQAAAPFSSPFLFIRAWVSPLSFPPPPREDREGGLCHLLPPAPCLRGTTMLSTGITPALGRAVPARAKTQWRGRALALGDVSGSRRQLLLLLPHVDAETSFAHRCLLPMMLNCSRRWGRWGRFGPTEPGMGQLGGSAPPPSPPLSLVEPAAASPIAPRVGAHCCEEPRAPGDFFVSRAEALGSGLGWTCQGEAAQGVSCAGWDHQVLLRMAGPAKATHRGSPYLPWSKGRGHLPLPGAGKTFFPSNIHQRIWYRNNRPFTVVYFKKCTKKNGFSSHKSCSLAFFPSPTTHTYKQH